MGIFLWFSVFWYGYLNRHRDNIQGQPIIIQSQSILQLLLLHTDNVFVVDNIAKNNEFNGNNAKKHLQEGIQIKQNRVGREIKKIIRQSIGRLKW